MRESRTKDKTHLPPDSTELWLKVQKKSSTGHTRHRKPPEDSFEAWIEERVGRTLKHERVLE